MEDNNQIYVTLRSLHQLRKLLKDKDYEYIEDVYNKLGSILSEKKEDYELQKLQEEERLRKIAEAKEMLEKIGLSIEDLTGESQKVKKAKNTPKSKYTYTDKNGKQKFWHGYGKTPVGLQKLLDQGHNLDEFLIEKTIGDQNIQNG